ncbi:hypothetical protein EVAR_26051_1 [Eumeta japonica]|uniref:Uncharacterized protein n=1 Tax=Eumeta variegata TaxID=151549 RepID=A0A4C1VR20_EUMVA|nr:hypothetical protein EVAR_26051_1 [Eumeta japonica]
MSKEGYNTSGTSERRESDNKVVLEKLQSYLKDKLSSDIPEGGGNYSQPGTSYDQRPSQISTIDDNHIVRDVLNLKKAALFRQPEVIELLKSISENVKN